LGTAELSIGEGQGELGQIIEISISNSTDHERKHQHRDKDQPPVTACPGSALIIHLGPWTFKKPNPSPS
jgi:hypothetical protein